MNEMTFLKIANQFVIFKISFNFVKSLPETEAQK